MFFTYELHYYLLHYQSTISWNMILLDKEPAKRAEKFLKDFNQSLEVIVLENSASTVQNSATALGCDDGAIVKSLLI